MHIILWSPPNVLDVLQTVLGNWTVGEGLLRAPLTRIRLPPPAPGQSELTQTWLLSWHSPGLNFLNVLNVTIIIFWWVHTYTISCCCCFVLVCVLGVRWSICAKHCNIRIFSIVTNALSVSLFIFVSHIVAFVDSSPYFDFIVDGGFPCSFSLLSDFEYNNCLLSVGWLIPVTVTWFCP